MRAVAHRCVGLAAGVLVWAALESHAPLALLAVPAGLAGGNAPDRLEWLGNRRWLPHRTFTHWLVLWASLLGLALVHLDAPWSAAVAGFAAGGLSHLAGDLPNPAGVPLLLPSRRVSLGWWPSGAHDLPLSLAALAVATAAVWWRLA